MSSKRLGRILWGMSSQVFSSSISLALTIFTARSVSAEEYGIFAIALTSAFFVQGLIRSLTSEVLVFRHSSTENEDRQKLTAACLSASTGYGLGAAAVSVVIGMTLGASLWFVLAFAVLGLVIQDNVRFVLMAHGNSKLATGLDGVALLTTVGLLFLAVALDNLNWFVVAWGTAAWISAIAGLAVLKPRLGWRNMKLWQNRAWHESKFFASDFLLTNVVSTAAVYFIAILLGAAAAGQIRAASMLVLPVLLLTRGMILAVASEANRLVATESYKAVKTLGLIMSGSSVAVTSLWIPLVWLVPMDTLEIFLGDSARGAAEVFPYVAVATAAAGLAAGPNIILKAAGRVRTAFIGKIVALPLSAGGVVLLSIASGAAGSQLGLAMGELARAVWGWSWAISWLRSRSSEVKMQDEQSRRSSRRTL